MQFALTLDPEAADAGNLLESDWTFIGAATRDLTHCYHDYPARMIPQIARRLITQFGSTGGSLFDPYCGTGTSLVEGRVSGLNVMGTDLNPLARLIAQAKTAVIDPEKLDAAFQDWKAFSKRRTSQSLNKAGLAIDRLDFWFKPAVITQLTRVRRFIDELTDDSIRQFFQVAFSETVRECSNTRNNEFKLYRYDEATLKKFAPDVNGTMTAKLRRNTTGLSAYLRRIAGLEHVPVARVFEFNTVDGVPSSAIPPESIDIVVTSPPYGDSHTTVAYGQYSRLSAAWLGLHEPQKVDRRLMGGKIAKESSLTPSNRLNDAVESIRQVDAKRSLEVSAFYADLQRSIVNVASVIRQRGHACYVVGNRKVKGIVLPTDDFVRCCFEQQGFHYVSTFVRGIPNKRMPLRNSPSNAVGAVDATMTNEYIVVMKKD